jgi:hypothetical protein
MPGRPQPPLLANPLEDIAVLTDPANISHVWKAGVAVKEPAPA